jgi:hypothetical protein
MDDYEVPMDVVREVVSNALAHRDYGANQRVLISVQPEVIEVRNPGQFPENFDWDDLLTSPGHSFTRNAAISRFLQGLGGFEGFGRGFEIFGKYRKQYGADSITFKNFGDDTVIVSIRRPERRLELQQSLASQTRARLLHRTLADRSRAKDISEVFVESKLRRQDGFEISVSKDLSVFNSLQQKTLIVGGAGSGKTVTAKMLVRNLLEASDAGESVFPVYVELRKLTRTDSLLENIAQLADLDERSFSRAVLQGSAYLVFDGLDEMEPSHRRVFLNEILNLTRQHSPMRVIVTTRPDSGIENEFLETGFDLVSIAPLSSSAITSFLERRSDGWFEPSVRQDQIQSIRKLIDDAPEFTTSPLLLEMLLVSYGSHGSRPIARTQLLENALEGLLTYHDSLKDHYIRERILDTSQLRSALEVFALFTTLDRKYYFDEDTMAQVSERVIEFLSLRIVSRDLISDFKDSGVLVRDGTYWLFAHRIFHEYLAACSLPKHIQSLSGLINVLGVFSESIGSADFLELAVEQWTRDRRNTLEDWRKALDREDIDGELTQAAKEQIIVLAEKYLGRSKNVRSIDELLKR